MGAPAAARGRGRSSGTAGLGMPPSLQRFEHRIAGDQVALPIGDTELHQVQDVAVGVGLPATFVQKVPHRHKWKGKQPSYCRTRLLGDTPAHSGPDIVHLQVQRKLLRAPRVARRVVKEQVPLDGIVIRGETSVDQAAITGESMPVTKMEDDEVFAGTFNQEGAIDVRVTKEARDSTLARVIELVAEAQSERSPTQRLIDRFSHPYALSVIAIVTLVILVGVFVLQRPFDDVFYRAMTLLVVASPCALVISTPASLLATR